MQDIGFDTVQTAVSLSGVPYRLYRTTVPPNLLGWDVSATPTVGDVNVAVRRDVAASENFNDADSEVAGSAVDGVTLVPPAPPASATLAIRLLQPQRLNFSSAENGNGFSHSVSGSLLAGQRLLYEVPVPAPSMCRQETVRWCGRNSGRLTAIPIFSCVPAECPRKATTPPVRPTFSGNRWCLTV